MPIAYLLRIELRDFKIASYCELLDDLATPLSEHSQLYAPSTRKTT